MDPFLPYQPHKRTIWLRTRNWTLGLKPRTVRKASLSMLLRTITMTRNRTTKATWTSKLSRYTLVFFEPLRVSFEKAFLLHEKRYLLLLLFPSCLNLFELHYFDFPKEWTIQLQVHPLDSPDSWTIFLFEELHSLGRLHLKPVFIIQRTYFYEAPSLFRFINFKFWEAFHTNCMLWWKPLFWSILRSFIIEMTFYSFNIMQKLSFYLMFRKNFKSFCQYLFLN